MPELIRVILLGLIEGITEFLPISSTGHLLVAEHWLGARSDVFNVVIQAGAILAVTLIYRQRLWQLATGLRDAGNRDYAAKLAVAFLITAVLGFIVTKLGFKLPERITPVACAFVIGGVWMIAAEYFAAKRADNTKVSWLVAVLVGLAQIVAAIFPGTSRSSATIFVAMLA
jgi:undecaprenyl-diphosphatase